MTLSSVGHLKQPDWNRALALGTAVAINLTALGLLAVMQPSLEPSLGLTAKRSVIEAIWIDPPRELPPVPLAPPRASVSVPVAAPPVRTQTVTHVSSVTEPLESTTFVDSVKSDPLELPGAAIGLGNAIGLPADRDAGVALTTPSTPPYPVASVRKRQEGTVLLEVLVGASGAATEVRILRSSGHRELDRSARDHVLRAWIFQPAIREGQPVAAWVRVPIEFSLATR